MNTTNPTPINTMYANVTAVLYVELPDGRIKYQAFAKLDLMAHLEQAGAGGQSHEDAVLTGTIDSVESLKRDLRAILAAQGIFVPKGEVEPEMVSSLEAPDPSVFGAG